MQENRLPSLQPSSKPTRTKFTAHSNSAYTCMNSNLTFQGKKQTPSNETSRRWCFPCKAPGYILTSWLTLACWQHLWSTQLVSSREQPQSQHTTRTPESTPTSTSFNHNFLKFHSFKECLTEHFYSIFLLILCTSLQGLQPLSKHQEGLGLKTTSSIKEQSLQFQVKTSRLQHERYNSSPSLICQMSPVHIEMESITVSICLWCNYLLGLQRKIPLEQVSGWHMVTQLCWKSICINPS